ncbi:MAG: beta-lactamase family protein [Deltaproteobacteria bacterium]|nr:beta-lactamase family protein [Deltaproteobacteria bacterium]
MNSSYRRFFHLFTVIPFILFTMTTLCVISWAQENQQSSQREPEAGLSPIPLAAAKLTADDLAAFLDGLVPLQMERDDIAGLVIVFVKDGKTLFEKGYGYADREKKRPVSVEETLFRPGSISKLFTWTAVMQLVEQGKLNLDRDVNEYLDFKIPSDFSEPITLRNIMTHTPGFEEAIKELFVASPEDLMPLDQYLLTHMPSRIFPPGTTPAYSNYATALAGYIVQRVSGEKFEDYISAHIFQPLGMAHSTFIQPLPENMKPFMSEGYRLGSGKPQKFEIIPASPAGALSITGADIARFMIAHLQEGEYNGNRILTPATTRLMHSRHSESSSGMNGMCLGFYEESRNGERIIGHGGDTLWFHSDLHLVLNKNLGFFISVNSAGRDSQLRDSLWRHFMDRYFPYELPPANPADEKMTNAKIVSRSYLTSRRSETNFLRIGSYFSELTFSANPDGTIQSKAIKALNGQPKRFEEIEPLIYREVDGQMRLAFTQEPDGEMTLNPAPIIGYISVPWYGSQKFLMVILFTSVIVTLLTLIFWIIAGRVRKHYGNSLGLVGFPRILRLGTRIVCVFILASYIAWAIPLIRLIRDITESASMDPWFRFAQILTSITMVLTIIAVINLIAVWFQSRWWWSKIWETLIGFASLAFVWFVIFGRLWEKTLMY